MRQTNLLDSLLKDLYFCPSANKEQNSFSCRVFSKKILESRKTCKSHHIFLNMHIYCNYYDDEYVGFEISHELIYN